jgi:hypothetical protein
MCISLRSRFVGDINTQLEKRHLEEDEVHEKHADEHSFSQNELRKNHSLDQFLLFDIFFVQLIDPHNHFSQFVSWVHSRWVLSLITDEILQFLRSEEWSHVNQVMTNWVELLLEKSLLKKAFLFECFFLFLQQISGLWSDIATFFSDRSESKLFSIWW